MTKNYLQEDEEPEHPLRWTQDGDEDSPVDWRELQQKRDELARKLNGHPDNIDVQRRETDKAIVQRIDTPEIFAAVHAELGGNVSREALRHFLLGCKDSYVFDQRRMALKRGEGSSDRTTKMEMMAPWLVGHKNQRGGVIDVPAGLVSISPTQGQNNSRDLKLAGLWQRISEFYEEATGEPFKPNFVHPKGGYLHSVKKPADDETHVAEVVDARNRAARFLVTVLKVMEDSPAPHPSFAQRAAALQQWVRDRDRPKDRKRGQRVRRSARPKT